MFVLNTWDTIFSGEYGSEELNIIHKDDIFISFLKTKDAENLLVQIYKIFLVTGELETFVETLPYPCILYEKHFSVGEKNTYKYFILNTDTEYVNKNNFDDFINKKTIDLNKKVSLVLSIMKSYNLKLLSLKVLPKEQKDNFYSDPFIIKVLTNLPSNVMFSSSTMVDKFLIGRKNKYPVNMTLEQLDKLGIFNSERDDRLFALKLICETYLLASKKIIVFDEYGGFKSLSYPQQHEDVLKKFDESMDSFGFPSNYINYFQIKMPLNIVSKESFIKMFNFSKVSKDIINVAYNNKILNIDELIKNIESLSINDNITKFEKKRIISKLLIINKKYQNYFGETDVSSLFMNRFKHLGSTKILKIDKNDIFCNHYIYSILKKINEQVKDEILLVFPEMSDFFNNFYIHKDIISILKSNNKIRYILSSESEKDIKNNEFLNGKIEMVNGNDAVMVYPKKMPLRLLLRATITSSNIKIKTD